MADNQSSTFPPLAWLQHQQPGQPHRQPDEPDRYGNNCGSPYAYVDRYPVNLAAALWCNIPGDKVRLILDTATEVARAIFKHPNYSCLEDKCRAIHAAIEAGTLAVYHEQGGRVVDHVAPERRHVMRHELKDWIARYHPDQKADALFDEIERATHPNIDANSFMALQARLQDSEYQRKEASDELKAVHEWWARESGNFERLRQENAELRARIAAMDKSSPVEGVTVTLPHMNKALRALFKVMWDNWKEPNPKRVPKQVHIGAEIDEAMGWSPEGDGTPSRNATALAKLIKPDPPE